MPRKSKRKSTNCLAAGIFVGNMQCTHTAFSNKYVEREENELFASIRLSDRAHLSHIISKVHVVNSITNRLFQKELVPSGSLGISYNIWLTIDKIVKEQFAQSFKYQSLRLLNRSKCCSKV